MKSILITGCSSGMGLAAAKGLRGRGYRVFPTARRSEDVKRLKAEGFEALPLDLDDSASLHKAVENLADLTDQRLYGLFNNAGFGQWGAVEDLSRDALRAQFETNLFGLIELTNLILPWMRTQGTGRIVQNSSVLGILALPYRGAYVASKFALEGITDALRLELKGTGIHVCLIEPGPVMTKFRENAHRAFIERIDRERSPHREIYRVLERRLMAKGPKSRFTQPPEAILKPLLHALESPSPKARYTLPPTPWIGFMKRLLPTTLLDRLSLKIA